MDQRGLFGLQEHLEPLSAIGDPPEVLDTTVDFEYLRGWLAEGLGYSDGAKGERSACSPVSAAPLPDRPGASLSEGNGD